MGETVSKNGGGIMVICFLGFSLEWKARSMERGWRREIWEKQ